MKRRKSLKLSRSSSKKRITPRQLAKLSRRKLKKIRKDLTELPTGIIALDNILIGGIAPGELNVIYAKGI